MPKKVCIVGLGYVGLPLACLSSQYFEVTGLDIDQDKVNKINQGICPLDEHYTKQLFNQKQIKATTDQTTIKEADIVVVCVPTPVDKEFNPDLTPLKSATTMIAQYIKQGQLIIIESTIYPGTTQEVIIPILEQNTLQLKAGTDFGVAYCPERIDPGNKKWFLQNIPRVVAGLTQNNAEQAQQFYQTFITAEIMTLQSIKSAEAVKILENTFRDINIAFVNEMAKSFDSMGIDLQEVIKGASTKPFGFMPFYPGPGVGGHCIPVDPYYLIEKAKKTGFDHQFLKLARTINKSMPLYTIEILEQALQQQGQQLPGSKIGVLGVAYKAGIDDVRESPALKIIESLKQKGAEVHVFDPYVPHLSPTTELSQFLDHIDHLILATNHKEFKDIEEQLKQKNIKLVIDTRHALSKQKLESLGITYKSIGRG